MIFPQTEHDVRHVACDKFDLLVIDGGADSNTYRVHDFLMQTCFYLLSECTVTH